MPAFPFNPLGATVIAVGGLSSLGLLVLIIALCAALVEHGVASGNAKRAAPETARTALPPMHVVAYATLGPPHDAGLALGESLATVRREFAPWAATVTTWSPRDLPASVTARVAAACDGLSWPQQRVHCGAAKHGFWRWKPHVVERRLRQIPEGEWLLYLDGNVARNVESLPGPDFGDYLRRWFALCGDEDILLHGEKFGLSVALNCRRDAWQSLISRRAATREPYSSAWRMLIRNSPRGRRFVAEWRALCDQPRLLWPATNPHQAAPIMHMHDEALLNLTVGVWKDRGWLPWGFPHNRSAPTRHVTPESVLPGVSSGWLRELLAPVLPWRVMRMPITGTQKLRACEHAHKKQAA